MTIKAIIFDMDGVLVDTHLLHDITLRAAVEASEHEWIQPAICCTKTSLQKLEEMGITGNNAKEIYVRKKELYIQMLPEYIVPRTELQSLIRDCRSFGLVIGICSNSATSAILSGLHLAGLNNLFSEYQITANDSVSGLKGKPEPDLYRYAVQKLGIKPEETLVFEDSTDGFVAATRAYCNVEFVDYALLPTKLDAFLKTFSVNKRKVA